MKTDSIFYELFLNLPDSLFALLGLPPEIANEYQFTSQELKQLAKRIDGLFLPLTIDKPIYFVEVQFQKDESLYYRLFTEIFTYLGQYKPPQNFQAVVLWGKKSLDVALPPDYQIFKDCGKLDIIYLDELNLNAQDNHDNIGIEIIKLIVAKEKQAKNQVEKLFSLITTQTDSLTQKRDLIELVEKILIYKFTKYTKEELDKMFTLTDFKQTRFYQDTFSEGKIEGKLEGKIEGKIEGKLEGKLEGKIEGKIDSIPNLIKLGLTPEQVAIALNIDLELVKKFSQIN